MFDLSNLGYQTPADMSDVNGGFGQNPLTHDASVFHDYLDIVDPDGDDDAWIWGAQDYLEPPDGWDIDVGGFEDLFAVDDGLQQELPPGPCSQAHASSLDDGVPESNNTDLDWNADRMEALDLEKMWLSVSQLCTFPAHPGRKLTWLPTYLET